MACQYSQQFNPCRCLNGKQASDSCDRRLVSGTRLSVRLNRGRVPAL